MPMLIQQNHIYTLKQTWSQPCWSMAEFKLIECAMQDFYDSASTHNLAGSVVLDCFIAYSDFIIIASLTMLMFGCL